MASPSQTSTDGMVTPDPDAIESTAKEKGKEVLHGSQITEKEKTTTSKLEDYQEAAHAAHDGGITPTATTTINSDPATNLINVPEPQSPSDVPAVSDRELTRATWALLSLSFFIADVSAGLGPFLGVFLQEHGWGPGLIGTVSTTGGVVAMLLTVPMGALIDATTYKRSLAAASTLICMGANVLIFLSPSAKELVFVAQIIVAGAGVALMPVMVALTLGVARQKGFHTLNGRVQAVNHAGNMTEAGLGAILGSRFGMRAVFYLSWAFGVVTLVSIAIIPAKAVDHQAARGLEKTNTRSGGQAATTNQEDHRPQPSQPQEQPEEHAEAWKMLVQCKELLVLGVALLAFHLGNAAVLPLYGQAVVAAHKAEPASFTGVTVVVAQGTMVIMALAASRLAVIHGVGYWPIILVSFCSLPVRTVLAGTFIESWGVWPVQVLDGIGAGLQSVATPGSVAQVLSHSGRVNVGLGAVMTCQGVGASLSPVLAGWIAQEKGYNIALYVMGIFPMVSIALWIGFIKILRKPNLPSGQESE
ncbi:uncharacterized protein PgNI_11708 [Pyricularia grisea]|uniref:Major facilitator superfamily (MFS) profile domain-containing protein n=1 Tax=Pyricularia grisea TaxID=148305 RepID=A0A6P8ANT2_PYRGI|nr:uncharacterized protein PgNI_11708 [Pyricularia grisea]TLD03688.1 hypothetical protein PgNI_11708 [Pyricularia grisea]